MKKLTFPVLGALALTLACSSVFAVDGTITVNGVITDGTCILEGYYHSTGLKDITTDLGAIPKSRFTDPTNFPLLGMYIPMRLSNATGTGSCDAATSKAFKGIHLSAISPAEDLDATDKTLLVNKAGNASTTNPVFVRIGTEDNANNTVVDLSEPWGVQAKSPVKNDAVAYVANYFSKTGIVDAQNVQVKINYTMHYN